MIAGGTGQFAYSDLIDLLYKEQLILDRPDCKEAAEALSPILKKNPFAKFSFEFILGARKIEDIHSITYQQLLYLSERGKMKVTLRIDDRSSLI